MANPNAFMEVDDMWKRRNIIVVSQKTINHKTLIDHKELIKEAVSLQNDDSSCHLPQLHALARERMEP